MKWCVGFLLGLFVLGNVLADSPEYHTFTCKDGRTVHARILEVNLDSQKILLERKNAVKAWVSMDIFLEEDQRYINQSGNETGLPAYLTFDLTTPKGEDLTVEFEKVSLRNKAIVIHGWTQKGGYVPVQPIDYPDVRTFRGRIKGGDPSTQLFMTINSKSIAKVEALRDKVYQWKIDELDLSDSLPLADTSPFNINDKQIAIKDSKVASVSGTPNVDYLATPSIFKFLANDPLQLLPLGLEIRYKDLKKYDGLTNAVAYIEGLVNVYDYFLAREAKVSCEITMVVFRNDQDESSDGSTPYELGYSVGSAVNKEWQTATVLKPYIDHWSQLYVNGSGTANGQIGHARKCSAAGAMYHEATHNWGCGHNSYGFDSHGNGGPGIAPVNIEFMIGIRNRLVADKSDLSLVERPLSNVYKTPLHSYTHFDAAITKINTPVDIPVLSNDHDSGDRAFSISHFTQRTRHNGVVKKLPGNVLRYTPAPGYTGKDIIVYEVINEARIRSRDLALVEVVNGDLTLHCSLDKYAGNLLADQTGNRHHATLLKGQVADLSITGVKGNALIAGAGIVLDASASLPLDVPVGEDGDAYAYPFDYTMKTGNHFDPMSGDYSLSFWFKLRRTPDSSTVFLAEKCWSKSKVPYGFRIFMQGDRLQLDIKEFGTDIPLKSTTWFNEPLEGGRWYHLAMVIDRSNRSVQKQHKAVLYVNGQISTADPILLEPRSFILNGRYPLILGRDTLGDLAFDDIKLFTRVMTDQELKKELAGVIYPAYGPEPGFQQTRVSTTNPSLKWNKGNENSSRFQLYFGDDKEAVKSATSRSSEFKILTKNNEYQLKEELREGSAYFWRVDKVLANGAILKGDIWTFYTVPQRSRLLSGLRSWWGFNERQGEKIYDSINGRSGLMEGKVVRKPGIFGNCLTFPDDPDPSQFNKNKAIIGYGFVPDNDLSVSLWARKAGGKDRWNILQLGATYKFALGKRPYLYLKGLDVPQSRITDRSKTMASGNELIQNAWHHLLFIRKDDTFYTYLDGILTWTETVPADIPAVDVGGKSWFGQGFIGAVDEVMIWDRAIDHIDRDLLFSEFSDQIKLSRWEHLSKESIEKLSYSATAPDSISSTSLLEKFSSIGENYGFLLEALFIPPVGGSYSFKSKSSVGSHQLNIEQSSTGRASTKPKLTKLKLNADGRYPVKVLNAVGDRKGKILHFETIITDPDGEIHLLGYPYMRSMDLATATNVAPVFINPIQYAGLEGKPFNASVSGYAYDPDPWEQLRFRKIAGPDWMSISDDGVFSVSTSVKAGTYTATIEAADRSGATGTVPLTLHLNKNEPPVWDQKIAISAVTKEHTYVNLHLFVKDANLIQEDSLTFEIASGKKNWIKLKGENKLQISNKAQEGTYTVDVIATDSFGLKATGTIHVTVNP